MTKTKADETRPPNESLVDGTQPGALSDFQAEALARRKLLKLAVYAAPVVVGSLVTRPAAASAPSCGPSGCVPDSVCNPACWPKVH